MAVVKGDGYGHGATEVAMSAMREGIESFAVATVHEGIELRRVGVTGEVLVLEANLDASAICEAGWAGLSLAITDANYAKFVSQIASQFCSCPIRVHLNIDTGMCRFGVEHSLAPGHVADIASRPSLDIRGLYSHLACPENTVTTERQLQRFRRSIESSRNFIPTNSIYHIANSAGVFLDDRLHFDMVRVGLALYGVKPNKTLCNCNLLQTAMSVYARILQVKEINLGEGIGYGHSFITTKPMSLAIVGIGYADGVPYSLSNKMDVLIRGQRAKQIGSITMDQLMIDVTGLQAKCGEIVTLIGREGEDAISVWDWAEAGNTIPWEILCNLGGRLPKIHREEMNQRKSRSISDLQTGVNQFSHAPPSRKVRGIR